MFKVWNIIDAGLFARSAGHHYWEIKALTDELLARSADVRIFSHKDAPIAQFPRARVYPTFSVFYYKIFSLDPCWGVIENFVLHNQAFQNDLAQVDQSLFRGSLTLFPTLSQRQLLATMRWLAHFEDSARPKAVITLQAPNSREIARIYELLWTNCPAAVKKDLAITVRSTVFADRFERLLGVRPYVLPSPLGAHNRLTEIVAKHVPESMVVSFVAGARPERGFMQIPEVVKLCKPLNLRFFIQAKRDEESPVDLSVLTALREYPNVELHEGLLERDAYHNAIAKSIVLIPYDANIYQWRWSGVYAEAKSLGAPVIVGAGSWIADEVKSSGNGLVFEENTPAAIAACIAKAQHEFSDLRARAAICAQKFNAENGPDRCVDAIESMFAKQQL